MCIDMHNLRIVDSSRWLSTASQCGRPQSQQRLKTCQSIDSQLDLSTADILVCRQLTSNCRKLINSRPKRESAYLSPFTAGQGLLTAASFFSIWVVFWLGFQRDFWISFSRGGWLVIRMVLCFLICACVFFLLWWSRYTACYGWLLGAFAMSLIVWWFIQQKRWCISDMLWFVPCGY